MTTMIVVSAVAIGGWLALYRLPLGATWRRRRVALWLADRVQLGADAAFALLGTAIYVGLGVLVFFAIMRAGGLTVASLIGRPSGLAVATGALAIAGTSSLNTLWISALYRVRPDVDIPGEITRIQWIWSIMSLPKRARWIIPATAALVEECVFRGALFNGLGARGASFLLAMGLSTAVFAVGQIVLVSTWTQAFVMGVSSCTLGLVGSLVVAATGSIVPALVLHTTFAGFYTGMGTTSSSTSTSVVRRSF